MKTDTRMLERIASGEAFRVLRFAGEDDTDYFLRVQREVQQAALAALSTATPPVDGEAKMREVIDGNAARRIIQSALGADFRLPGIYANRIAKSMREALASTQTGGGE